MRKSASQDSTEMKQTIVLNDSEIEEILSCLGICVYLAKFLEMLLQRVR